MELKFHHKKLAIFRRKYIKIEVKFENLFLYVFAVFLPLFRASGGRFGRFSA